MILYSIMPLEKVMEGAEDQNTMQLEEIVLQGCLMQVERLGPAEARIVRLLSPDPVHYLNPAWAPGARIQFQPRSGG